MCILKLMKYSIYYLQETDGLVGEADKQTNMWNTNAIRGI